MMRITGSETMMIPMERMRARQYPNTPARNRIRRGPLPWFMVRRMMAEADCQIRRLEPKARALVSSPAIKKQKIIPTKIV